MRARFVASSLWILCAVGAPPTSVVAADDPPAATLLHVPFSPLPGLILTEAQIGGEPHLVMLDTGTTNLVLDQSLGRLVGAEIARVTITHNGIQPQSSVRFAGPAVQIQAAPPTHASVVLSDLTLLRALYGLPIDAFISLHELDAAGKVLLDYDHDALEVHTGPWKLDGADCHEVNLDVTENTPNFAATLDGHHVAVMVDTGFSGSVILPTFLFRCLSAAGAIEVNTRPERITGYASTGSYEQGWFLRGELMGKSLAGVSVQSLGSEAAVVGLDWLCAFNVEIDFANSQLRYQARPAARPPVVPALMVGAAFGYTRAGIEVGAFQTHTWGAVKAAGLQPGDVIESFDGVASAALDSVRVGEIVAAKAGETIEVRYVRKSDGTHATTRLALPEFISAWNFPGRKPPGVD